MELFNGIQVIKCGIRRVLNRARVGDTASQDIKLLSAMCAEVHVLIAGNGGKYWYYFPDKIENVDVAQYLMARNGVVPTLRMSRYFAGWGNRRPALRLSQSYLLQHPEQNAFVKQIEESDSRTIGDANLQQQLLIIRNQIHQK